MQLGSLHWDAAHTHLTFKVADRQPAPAVLVQSRETPPQMFHERIGVVVEGPDRSQTFSSQRLMVNHSNEYRPPKPGDGPDQWKTTVSAPTAEAR